ncbi:hypothetical protein V0U79_00015 [Hyphobacterium sp. HN65]|uniref:PH domain-containing protein n=1 Tax=Hyphobacterium lacteum TaxID=3116575 RepID=A0ABU7LLC2_9PROT|nr:hypothetical protein [Hyphobacterium sp. HN65]MEE2524734.1 hypothetical protein [Hyphobacterium sp. HN65]
MDTERIYGRLSLDNALLMVGIPVALLFQMFFGPNPPEEIRVFLYALFWLVIVIVAVQHAVLLFRIYYLELTPEGLREHGSVIRREAAWRDIHSFYVAAPGMTGCRLTNGKSFSISHLIGRSPNTLIPLLEARRAKALGLGS